MLDKIKQAIPTSLKKGIKNVLGIKEPENIPNIIYDEYVGKKILDGQEAGDKIYQLLATQKPAMIARIGSTEQSCLNNYFLIQNKKLKGWKPAIKEEMWHASGFFSNTPDMMERFAKEMVIHLQNVDILGVWFNEGEKYVCEQICPQANFIKLENIEPYYHENPWSRILEGKRVLVIHPFAQSIERQFLKREFLFNNKSILPPFELQTIQAVQSITKNKPLFRTWFDALNHMTEEVSKKDFDIAIIGAGAYGLPLASTIKKMGKQAVHIGGATQILFGITGRRWEERNFFRNLFNEYWIKPNDNEKPKNADTMEGGAYW